MVATPLPIKLVMALASDIKRSTPNKRASPSIGMTLVADKVEAKITKPLPVTPAAPLEVTISIPSITSI